MISSAPAQVVVSPRDGLELQLVQIWEELLNIQPIGVNQDFFELGGDSLLAMALLARIVQDTGRTLPTSGLFEARTIERMGELLREETSTSNRSLLVPIQPLGSRRPFFCVHPGGGNVLCYMQLANELGTDQPFYGLQCRGLDDDLAPLESYQAMAAEYLAEVRRVQPHGPYALGGWSVGGVLAFEMAQQLRAEGEEVAVLAIMDSGVLYAIAVLLAMFPKGESGLLDVVRMESAEQLAEFRRRSAPARLVPAHADDRLAMRIKRLFSANMHMMMRYHSQPYDGRISLIRAADAIVKARLDPQHEWTGVCEQVDLHVVPGDHLTMIHEPHVQILAEQLRKCLDAAL